MSQVGQQNVYCVAINFALTSFGNFLIIFSVRKVQVVIKLNDSYATESTHWIPTPSTIIKIHLTQVHMFIF